MAQPFMASGLQKRQSSFGAINLGDSEYGVAVIGPLILKANLCAMTI